MKWLMWLKSCFAVWYDEIVDLYHTKIKEVTKGRVAKGVAVIKVVSYTTAKEGKPVNM